jgi:hypothetical protein
VLSLAAIALLAGSSWTLGSAALGRLAWPELRVYERAALRLTAGLGLTALLLSLMALAGWFSQTTAVLVVLATIGAGWIVYGTWRCKIAVGRPFQGRQGGAESTAPQFSAPWVRTVSIGMLVCAVLASLGAIAPVTDDDALAYVVPVAHHIADTGAVRVWTDQARSMWPQSQQVLLAFLLHAGGDRLGAVTALEWWLCIGVVSALARRVCQHTEHIVPALVIALGAPVLAFQVASAKEDLLLLAASAAAAFCLAGSGGLAELAAAGLFAGVAAGAKYPGALIAAPALLWVLIHQRDRRLRSAAIVALTAAASGGLWYALNLWRYGNPVAPLIAGARGTPLDAQVAREFVDAYGAGRSLVAFVVAPARIFVESSMFCGRANLYNPLAYAGLGGLIVPAVRRRSGPLFFMAGVLYVGWFLTLQNARLLLPAAVLLAPAAADCLVPVVRRSKLLQALAIGAAALSLGIVAAVGSVRAVRYARDVRGPQGFLERETQNYADLQWMNAHLNRQRDRVASDHKVLGYLEVPSIFLDPSYQIEISRAELNDTKQLIEALRRQRITHLFGNRDSFPGLKPHLRTIYTNPSSRLGGVRFFREPPSEATAVFEIDYPAAAASGHHDR